MDWGGLMYYRGELLLALIKEAELIVAMYISRYLWAGHYEVSVGRWYIRLVFGPPQ